MKPVPRIYIHFADYYHIERARLNRVGAAQIRNSLSNAMRLCLLFADEVIFPLSSLYESLECQRLITEFPEFREHGILKVAAGDANIFDHLESKKLSYNETSTNHFLNAYRKKRSCVIMPSYIQRNGSSTGVIRAAWAQTARDGEVFRCLRDSGNISLPPRFEQIWSHVPDALGEQAFVPIHTVDVLRKQGFHGSALKHVVAPPIESAYVDGYVSSLHTYILLDVPYLAYEALEHRLQSRERLRYRDLVAGLTRYGLVEPILEADSRALFRLRSEPAWDELAESVRSGRSHEDASKQAKRVSEILNDSKVSSRATPQQLEMTTAMNKSESTNITTKFDTAIITALPIEMAAVELLLSPSKQPLRIDDDPNSYKATSIKLPDGTEKQVLLCLLNRMGNNSAATAATNLLRSFDVQHLFFCGIALGVPRPSEPSKHVRLGDVVVSDRRGVIQIDHRSLGPEGETNRSMLPPPPAPIARALNELTTNEYLGHRPWEPRIDSAVKAAPRFARPNASTDILFDSDGKTELPHPSDASRDPGHPKMHRGQIGSANTLVRDAKFRDEKAKEHDLFAIEMEGAGAQEALWNFGQSAMVVRGVCDYGVGKNDTWHHYAALAAAAVTVTLIIGI